MFRRYRIRYRANTLRARWWNYGLNGYYFITICTKLRQPFFGNIYNGQLSLSPIGIVVLDIWKMIPIRFPYIKIDKFVMMPDHLHGILRIEKPLEMDDDFVGARLIAPLQNHHPSDSDDMNSLEIQNQHSYRGGITGIHNPMLHQNLSRVVRWFKGRATFEIHKIDPTFQWQRGFNDRVIRDKKEYYRVKYYILFNPSHWNKDI